MLNVDIVNRGKFIIRENIMLLRVKFIMNILDGVFKFLVLYIKLKKRGENFNKNYNFVYVDIN